MSDDAATPPALLALLEERDTKIADLETTQESHDESIDSLRVRVNQLERLAKRRGFFPPPTLDAEGTAPDPHPPTTGARTRPVATHELEKVRAEVKAIRKAFEAGSSRTDAVAHHAKAIAQVREDVMAIRASLDALRESMRTETRWLRFEVASAMRGPSPGPVQAARATDELRRALADETAALKDEVARLRREVATLRQQESSREGSEN